MAYTGQIVRWHTGDFTTPEGEPLYVVYSDPGNSEGQTLAEATYYRASEAPQGAARFTFDPDPGGTLMDRAVEVGVPIGLGMLTGMGAGSLLAGAGLSGAGLSAATGATNAALWGGNPLQGAALSTVMNARPGSVADMSGIGSDFDASAFGGPQPDMTRFGGLGSDFDAEAFGGPQLDMTGFTSDFDAGAYGGSQPDMTRFGGLGSDFDAYPMGGEPVSDWSGVPLKIASGPGVADLFKVGLNGLGLMNALSGMNGGGGPALMGGGMPALQQSPANIFRPVAPGALHPFG